MAISDNHPYKGIFVQPNTNQAVVASNSANILIETYSGTPEPDPLFALLLEEGGEELRDKLDEALRAGRSLLEAVATRFLEIRDSRRQEREAAAEELLQVADRLTRPA